MVDYVRYWSNQAETPAKQILAWMGVPEGTYYKWRKRYGQVNEHNGWILATTGWKTGRGGRSSTATANTPWKVIAA